MNDLISKSKVIEVIKDYFKTIIDHTDDDVDCVLDYNKHLCNAIERMPVDYDVDKVVADLEKAESRFDTVSNSDMYTKNGIWLAKTIVKGAVKDE